MDKILRASKAGFPCIRNLWYSVNGYEQENDEHTQRIFDVGNYLEPMVVEWLKKDGWNVEYNPGSQSAEIEVTIPVNGGTIAGHPDCIISKGAVQNALVDIKTMNDRAFTLWEREGTLKSKPQYVTQLHIYAMGLEKLGRKIERLGIVGVNKNNSDMHIDFFDFNKFQTIDIIGQAEMVFSMDKPPSFNCPAEQWCCRYCEFCDKCELSDTSFAPVQLPEIPVTQDAVVLAAMKELKQARELNKEAKDLETHAKSVLDENVKDKGLQGIQGGGMIFFMSARMNSRFDSTAFKKAHPELVSQFTKQTSSVVYEIKEIAKIDD